MPSELDRLKAALAEHYRIERQLGTGGMSVVYLAEDRGRRRKVAIKVLRPELGAAVGGARFLREIAIAAQLAHPHLLPLYDSGEADGLLYSVMPYVAGGSLRERLALEGQLPIEEAVRLTREICSGLSYAHSLGIVHRDIKPENILFEGGHVVLSDFGLAQAVSDAAGEKLTATGIGIGTPVYMSPEQASGRQRLDNRTDIYSLGCVLYEMLAGDPPFTGANPQAVLARKSIEAPPSLRAVRETVPEQLEDVILTALAKAPADRFATAAAFADALSQASTSAMRSGSPAPRRRRIRNTMVAGLSGAVVLIASGWWVLNRAETRIGSLAVLPVRNLSGDERQVYLLDAMHGAIIGELSQVSALRTISQWSALRYRDADKSVPEIARELDVDALVEASAYATAESVRVQVQLIRAFPRERQLWSKTFSSDRRSVPTLQGQVARSIATALGASLTVQEEARLTRAVSVDPAAFDAYAKGRLAWNSYTADGIQESIAHFHEAIKRDSAYALAYVGLADAYGSLPYYAAVDPREVFPKAKEAATKALALDGSLEGAYTALAWTASAYEWDWSRAEELYRRALELSPSYAVGHQRYAQFLGAMGRFDEAITEMTKARELDPLSPRIMGHLGLIYDWAGQDDRAISIYRETLARNPTFARTRWDLGRAYLDQGQPDRAIAEFEEAARLGGRNTGGSATNKAELARALARAGRRADAKRILADMEVARTRGHIAALNIATVHAALDQRDQAFLWLERAYQERDADMFLLQVLTHFDPIREDPRFQDLLERMRFPA